MSGIMLDSTNPAAVAAAVKAGMTWRGQVIRAAAGYEDGSFAWPQAAKQQLRAAGLKVSNITVTGVPGVRVGDFESGDLDAANPAWMLEEHKAGRWPVAYSDRSDKQTLLGRLAVAGLQPGRDFGLWTATLDGSFTDLDGTDLRDQPGMVAVQYAQAESPVHDGGRPDLDVSVLTALGDQWLGLDPAPPTWQAALLASLKGVAADLASAIQVLEAHQ